MNESEIIKKISFQESQLSRSIKEAEIIHGIGKTATESTTFELAKEGSSINEYSTEIQISQQKVVEELKNLEQVHIDITRKEKEKEKVIKDQNIELEDFKNQQHNDLEEVRKKYNNKLKNTQKETETIYKKEENDGKSAISKKDKETKRILIQAEKSQNKIIKETEKIHNKRIKDLTKEFEDFSKQIELSKNNQIKELGKNHDNFLLEIVNIDKNLSKKKNEMSKGVETKEKNALLKSEISTLQGLLSEKKLDIEPRKLKLRELIENTEKESIQTIKDKENWINDEIEKSHLNLLSLTKSKTAEVTELTLEENTKFKEMKEVLDTSIVDLRAKQREIVKSIKEEKESSVFKKEKEVISSINEKEKEIEKSIAKANVDFEIERKKMLNNIQVNLQSATTNLDTTIKKYYDYFSNLPDIVANSTLTSENISEIGLNQ